MTTSLQPGRPRSIALIDLSYLFKKRFHMPREEHLAAKKVLSDLERLKEGIGHLIICRDAPPYHHRLTIFPEYKANRPEVTNEEREQKRFLFQEITRLGYNVAWCQGYEADDVIATLAKEYGEWCDDVRIVGADKDIAQCLTRHVTQYIPPVGDRDWEVRDVAGVQKKFGVFPEFMPLYQALVGDSSDNIPGVDKVGAKTAVELVNKYQTIERLAAGLATEAAAAGSKPSAVLKSLAANWDNLVLSLKLVTLDTAVPLDTESLLVKREPEPEKQVRNSMDVAFDGFTGNETPMPPKQDGVLDGALEEASRLYQAKLPDLREAFEGNTTPPAAAKDDALLEKEYERERKRNEEHDAEESEQRAAPTKSEVVPAAAGPVKARPPSSQALVNVPAMTQHFKYGMVTADLQPVDLTAAYQIAAWLIKGGLYQQYENEAQVFTIMVRAKEMGIGIATALAGHHIIDGKPVASADLIRALAERDPTFEYLYPKKMSATECTWVGKRKGYPEPVEFTYTIADAKAADLVKLTRWGKPSGWMLRPQDFLNKTAGSKLARLLWPGATLGLYCPEEMGVTLEEQREAA